MLIPPRCPGFTYADPGLFERYQSFVLRFGPCERPQGQERDTARELAATLHRAALDQEYSKAHEGSPDIYWLHQCAALVACIAIGRTAEFREYERNVLYYRDYPRRAEEVRAFIAYVEAFNEAESRYGTS